MKRKERLDCKLYWAKIFRWIKLWKCSFFMIGGYFNLWSIYYPSKTYQLCLNSIRKWIMAKSLLNLKKNCYLSHHMSVMIHEFPACLKIYYNAADINARNNLKITCGMAMWWYNCWKWNFTNIFCTIAKVKLNLVFCI